MDVDVRRHDGIRQSVYTGLVALRVQGRQIWGGTRHTLPEIVLRLTVGVGDLARVARDGYLPGFDPAADQELVEGRRRELKKELGNVLFSVVRWIDDLGFDVMECIDLSVEAQEKFASSGRPR